MKISRLLSLLLAVSMMFGIGAIAEETPIDTEAYLVEVSGQDWGIAGQTLAKRDAAGKNGAVVAGKGEAAEVGIKILQAGGNAIDAAVGTGLAICFFEPNANGLGGGGFMNIWLAGDQKNVALSSQFPAPQNVTEDYFAEILNEDGSVNNEKNAAFVASGKSVSIMKALATYQVALDNWGTMTMQEIIPYVTEAAKQGIRVTQNMKSLLDGAYSRLVLDEASSKLWLKDGALPYELGDVIYNQDWIDTLELIGEKGIEYFYKGELAQNIIDTIQATGGVMSMDDMATAMTDVMVIDEPVEVTYRGYKLFSMPLPSSGGVIIGEILNILENVDMASLGHNTPESIHVMAEAMKLAYADRAKYLGDPRYTADMPIKGMSSKEYAKSLFDQIGETANLDPMAGNPYPFESPSTTHFSVIDKDGNMACMTQSINSHFGSGITVPGTGIVLSNGLMSFDKVPGKPNSIEPGKLSLSSMTPTILLKPDGTPMLVSGSPGGERIIACMVQTIVNIVDHGMDIQETVYEPRVFGSANGKTIVEGRLPQDVIDALIAKGHDVQVDRDYNPNMGSSNSIMVLDDGTYHGCGDPRRDSQAAAY